MAGILLFMAASCGNTPEQASQPAAEQPTVNATTMSASTDPNAKKDPVCEMEYDTSWTEFAVHNGDTIRFCSDGCRMAFEARPDKYLKGK